MIVPQVRFNRRLTSLFDEPSDTKSTICCRLIRDRDSTARAPDPVPGAEAIPDLLAAFRRGLAKAGYVEGKNLTIEYRFTNGY